MLLECRRSRSGSSTTGGEFGGSAITKSTMGPMVVVQPQQKTHIISFAEVLYRWRPWYGRRVAVTQVASVTCTLD